MCFVGFSKDTVVFDEPPPTFQSGIQIENHPEFRLITEYPQIHLSDDVFRLPGHRNPRLAAWLSAALPGAGQVYNGQWWKVPIIYTGIGALIYFHEFNRRERNLFQTELRIRMNASDTLSIRNPDLERFSDAQIMEIRNFYRRNLEWVYIFSGLLYVLNIVDAVVFAHLATFDVSGSLSMRVEPFALPDSSPFALQHQRVPMQGGLRLTFTLR